MSNTIQSVIDEWTKAEDSLFSFEIRFHPVIDPSSLTPESPFIFMNFIIEVQGFFEDEDHSKPIKLHHERVISIDRLNTSPQYIKDLRNDLQLLTNAAYAEFEKILTSFKTPIYTSDPLHMK